MSKRAGFASQRLQRAQESYQVRFFLRCQDKAKTLFIETHGVLKRLRRAVVEIRGTGREAAENRSFDLANVLEFAIYQGLAEVRRGSAVVRLCGWSCGQIQPAHSDARQVGQVQATQINGLI